tara:strand:- start:424 stop:594 length:171 start_codon:yes stop_codon:yes gene_type:complete
MKIGERITLHDFMNSSSTNVELMSGATLCGCCQYYFKGNGGQDICNTCIKRNKGRK